MPTGLLSDDLLAGASHAVEETGSTLTFVLSPIEAAILRRLTIGDDVAFRYAARTSSLACFADRSLLGRVPARAAKRILKTPPEESFISDIFDRGIAVTVNWLQRDEI